MKKKLLVTTAALALSLTSLAPITSLAATEANPNTKVNNFQERNEQQSVLKANNSVTNQKLDIDSALAYAHKWWGKRNPEYKKYDPNDCMNYISQILKAGGLGENKPETIASEGVDSKKNYWYSKKQSDNIFTVSSTWINVGDFYTYWSKTQKVIQPNELDIMRDIEVGDVIQLQKKSEKRYSHAMFVVKKDAETVYLTGHTNDREKLDIRDIRDKYNFRVIKFS
ncbi:hypothetical protein DN407_31430 (plasmid) [Bacillus sp. JAS24-2]|uniref:amidase domain-containing protein n=1 Tax=Bacillus sp. JAS24-2 TaxID=2217832 RepID=UPI0011EE57A8|nr:amidase domain-containing protein [Bacillus sp. JAS24-2]QEL82906.1 hypothetical protein DN407_31430 [Bacillus sp. JAS24-2]